MGVAFLEAIKETTDFEGLIVTDLTLGPPKSAPPIPSSKLKLPLRGVDGTSGPLAGSSFLQIATPWPFLVGPGLNSFLSVWASHAAEGPGLDLSGLCLLPALRRGKLK